MRPRLGVLLLLPALGLVGIPLTAGSASAANTTLRTSNYHPLYGEAVRLSGALTPVRRVVYLQRLSGGHWRSISATRTGYRGAYAFNARTASSTYGYRTYARPVHGSGTKLSNTVYLTPTTPSLTLSSVDPAQIAQPSSNASRGSGATRYSLASGRFAPARPGKLVAVQGLVNGTWRLIGSGRQSSSGAFNAPVNSAYVAAATSFRAYSTPVSGRPTVYSHQTTATARTAVFADDFGGTSLSPLWATRNQPAFGRRQCSTPNASQVRVGSGVATLSVRRWYSHPTSACPHGKFYNGMIGTGAGGHSYKYGTFAARVKFQHGQGMHGSFWLQGPGVTGAEIDTAEYFGDGRSDGGFTQFVHYTNSKGQLSTVGGPRSLRPVIGSRRPSDGWHIYSVSWTPTNYVFRVDGVPTLSTNRNVATAPEEMILSLLSSDYEIPRMKTTQTYMQVDWVRAWQ